MILNHQINFTIDIIDVLEGVLTESRQLTYKSGIITGNSNNFYPAKVKYKSLEISRPNHSCIVISGKQILYIDPYKVSDAIDKADIILISHDHIDHYSPEDIVKIIKPETVIITTTSLQSKISKDFPNNTVHQLLPSGYEITQNRITIKSFPAYNIDKYNEDDKLYHTRSLGGIGFIIDIEGVRLLFAGDTDLTEELRIIADQPDADDIDIAFLPVSGIYVMTAEEAAEAANLINPKYAIPIHFGDIVGDVRDAEKFKALAQCEVEII